MKQWCAGTWTRIIWNKKMPRERERERERAAS
jgi:hypothetical protein